ncbi:MAG: DNA primase [Alphaproteobacteria bacterium]
MAFAPEFLDDIRNRLSLADAIGRKVKLIKRGREFQALCPFHQEKTPSFTVVEDKGFFHCFGCGAHGDVIGFVMRTDHMSFPEAVERLASEAGLAIPETSPADRQRAQAQRTLYSATEAACVWFESQLHAGAGAAALSYLQGRGFDDDTIARFRLGFAPGSRGALKSALGGDGGIPEALLIEAGLLIKPDDGRPAYDRFRGRVIFPICDRRGRPIAFGGRILGDGEPKYLNSPETPLFHKGQVLYGLAQALSPARESGTLVVTEGYTDVIALNVGGIASVAPLGTAITESQIRELWRVVAEPVLCFDGDRAGADAAGRAAVRALPLLTPGKSLGFVNLPKGEDPDSLLAKHGPKMLTDLVAKARPLARMIWDMETAGKSADTPERIAEIDHKLKARAFSIADRAVQKEYLDHFRNQVWADLKGGRRGQAGSGKGSRSHQQGQIHQKIPLSRPAPLGAGPAGSATRREQVLVATVLNHPGILSFIAEEFTTLEIATHDLGGLRQAILDIMASNTDLDAGGLKRHLTQQGFSQHLKRLCDPGGDVLDWFSLPNADSGDALTGWRHVAARHRRQGPLQAELAAAAAALARDQVTEDDWARFQALKRLMDEGEGDEAELEHFGAASGRPDMV